MTSIPKNPATEHRLYSQNDARRILDLADKYRGYASAYGSCLSNPNSRPFPYLRDSDGNPIKDDWYEDKVNNILRILEITSEELKEYPDIFSNEVEHLDSLYSNIKRICDEDKVNKRCSERLELLVIEREILNEKDPESIKRQEEK